MKKRYWVFGYDNYYPAGGMGDFQGDFDTLDEVNTYLIAIKKYWDITEVYDFHTDTFIPNN